MANDGTDKKKYEAPLIVPLGELAITMGLQCSPGTSASATCVGGGGAQSTCKDGASPQASCSSGTGAKASCNIGGVPTAACVGGSGR